MTVIGEAFVAVTPLSDGFAAKTEQQLGKSGFIGSLEKQFGNAGLLAGNSFTSKLLGAFKTAGGPGAGLSFGLALGAGVLVGLNSLGAQFGKVRSTIIKETGASGDALAGLFETVKRSVKEVPASLDDAGKAVTLLFKRGVPLGPQLDLLAQKELQLAKITKSELAPTVEQTTALFAKFNVPLREQGRELDVLFKASQRSGKSLAELVEPLVSGGAALSSFGFSLDQSIALITQLQIAGVNVAPALAGLKKAFSELAKEGKDPQEALHALVEEFKTGRNPTKAMADAIKLFGSRAGLELATAIKAGKFEVTDLLKVITDGKGGIIETGEATRSLADRFQLLRSRMEEDLSAIAVSVRKTLVSVVIQASGPLGDLVGSIGHLLVALAPLRFALVPVALVLRGILPTISAFAAGVDAIATGLQFLTTPLGATIVAIGGFAAVVSGAADGLVASAFSIGDSFTNLLKSGILTNPWFLAAAAVTALGASILLMRDKVDPAIQVAKEIGAAMFDAESGTSIFRAGIDNATEGLEKFLTAQVRAGKANALRTALNLAGTTVGELTDAVSGGAVAWDKFFASSTAAIKSVALGQGFKLSALQIAALTGTLEDQRQAFLLNARSQTEAAISTGVLTRAQKSAIVEQNRYKDGSVNTAGVLDQLNRVLAAAAEKQNAVILSTQDTRSALAGLAEDLATGAISAKDAEVELGALGLTGEGVTRALEGLKLQAQEINQTQDALTISTITTTDSYGELARRLATGAIGAAGATRELEAMGLSTEGAGAAFSDLDSQIRSFIDGALSQLPDVSTAIADFTSAITADQQALKSEQDKNVELRAKVNEALTKSSAGTREKLASIDLAIAQDQAKIASGSATTTDKLARDLLKRSQIIAGSGRASKELATEVEESNRRILAAQKKLADDSNPNRFTQNLLDNAAKIIGFTQSLTRLVELGFAPLAGELAKKGPEAAATLAAGLANSPAKAAIASKAAELGKAATDNFKKFLEENVPELTGVGAKQGLAVGKAIADGITRQLLENFPMLRQIGITTGEQILDGGKEGATSGSIIDPMLTLAKTKIPEFRGLGVEIGTAVSGGVRNILDKTNIAGPVAAAARTHIPEFRGLGVEVGTAVSGGIAAGIDSESSRLRVGGAILSITRYGVSVAKGALKISSPSQVFAKIGAQLGEGLAVGISSSASTVGTAVGLLTSRVATSVDANAGQISDALSRAVAISVPTEAAEQVGQALSTAVATGVSSSAGEVAVAAARATAGVDASFARAAVQVRPESEAFGRELASGLRSALSLAQTPVELPDAAGAIDRLGDQIRAATADVGEASSGVAKEAVAKINRSLADVAFDPKIRPSVEPVITPKIVPVTIPPVPDVVISARFAPIVLPDVPAFPPLEPTVSSSFSADSERLFDRFADRGTQAGQEAARNLATSLSEGVTSSRGEVTSALGRVIVFPDRDQTATAAGRQVVADVATGIGTSADRVTAAVAPILDSLATSVTDSLARVGSGEDAFAGFTANVQSSFADIGQTVRAGLDVAAASVGTAGELLAAQLDLSPLAGLGADAGRQVARNVGAGLASVTVALPPIQIPDTSREAATAGRDLGAQIATGFATTTGDVGELLAGRIDLSPIAALGKDAGSRVVRNVEAGLASITVRLPGVAVGAGFAAEVVDGVNTTRAQIADSIRRATEIPDTTGRALDAGRKLGDSLVSGVVQSASEISGAVGPIADDLNVSVSAAFARIGQGGPLLSNLSTSVDESITRLQSQLTGGIRDAAGAVRDATSEIVPTIDPTRFATSGSQAGATLGRGILDGIASTSAPIADAYARLARPTVAVNEAFTMPVGQRLGEGLAEGLDSSSIAVTGAAERLAERVQTVLDRQAGETISEWKRRLHEALDQQSGETISEWKNRLREILNIDPGRALQESFERAFDSIGRDAEKLRKILEFVTHSKIAPFEPPSALTIQAQAQSIQVPRPEDRANFDRMQGQQPVIGQVVFNEKIDPAHVAAELAWRLVGDF